MPHNLPIAGFVPFSTVDWPGKLVASIFTQGCPLKCGYCHNHEIRDMHTPTQPAWDTIETHLKARQGLLDGLVVSGGEPLAHAHPKPHQHAHNTPLGAVLHRTQQLGHATGLHTSGIYPTALTALLDANLINWVGIDVKATPNQMGEVTGANRMAVLLAKSLGSVANAGIDHEARLTLWPALVGRPGDAPQAVGDALIDYAVKVGEWAAGQGAQRFVVQRFQTATAPVGATEVGAVWDDAAMLGALAGLGVSVGVR